MAIRWPVYRHRIANRLPSADRRYVFDGPKPPKRKERGGLAALVESVRTGGGGGEGDDDDEQGMEMTFNAEPTTDAVLAAKGKGVAGAHRVSGAHRGARAPGGYDEEELPPTVFEVEEAKRKAKRREKKAAKAAAASGETVGGMEGEEEDAEFDYGDAADMPKELASDPFFAEAMADQQAEERREAKAAAKAGGARRDEGVGEGGRGQAAERLAKEAKKEKGKKGKREAPLSEAEAAAEAKRQAELELLMLGDDEEEIREARRGYNVRAPARRRGTDLPCTRSHPIALDRSHSVALGRRTEIGCPRVFPSSRSPLLLISSPPSQLHEAHLAHAHHFPCR